MELEEVVRGQGNRPEQPVFPSQIYHQLTKWSSQVPLIPWDSTFSPNQKETALVLAPRGLHSDPPSVEESMGPRGHAHLEAMPALSTSLHRTLDFLSQLAPRPLSWLA